MYQSPYDYYLQMPEEELGLDYGTSSKERYLATPGKLALGMSIGMGALPVAGVGAFLIRRAHNNAMRSGNAYARTVNKMMSTDFYKETTQTGRALQYLSPFKTREAFGWESKFRSKVGLSTPGKLWAPSVMPWMFALNGISNEVQSSGLSGIGVGAARQAGILGGGLAGQAAGAAIGSMILPGFGTLAGAIAGGVGGGMAGESIPDIIGWMKSKGRQWTLPDVGGSFRDSQMNMTMRMRSLNAIRTSQFNIRSTLGNEAFHLNFG